MITEKAPINITILKSIMGFKRHGAMSPLIVGGDIISNDKEKSEMLSSFFCSQTDITIESHHLETISKYRSDQRRTPHTFNFIPFTSAEVLRVINHLDASKACGPDRLPTKLIKMVSKDMKQCHH